MRKVWIVTWLLSCSSPLLFTYTVLNLNIHIIIENTFLYKSACNCSDSITECLFLSVSYIGIQIGYYYYCSTWKNFWFKLGQLGERLQSGKERHQNSSRSTVYFRGQFTYEQTTKFIFQRQTFLITLNKKKQSFIWIMCNQQSFIQNLFITSNSEHLKCTVS